MIDFRVFVLLCVVLGGMGQGVVAPKLPLLLHDSAQLAWDSGLSASLMYLAIFISTFYFGKLADRGRVHWLLGPGLMLYTATMLALGGAPSRVVFFIARFIEGLSLSAIFVSADFVLGRLSNLKERGRWLSYYGVAISVGLLLGPTISLGLARIGAPIVAPFVIVGAAALMLGLLSLSKRVPPVDLNVEVAGHLSNPIEYGPLITAVAYGFMEAALVATLPVLAAQYFQVKPEPGLIAIIVSAGVSSLFWGYLSDHWKPKGVVHLLFGILMLGPFLIWIFSGSLTRSLSSSSVFYLSCIIFGTLAGGLYPIGFAWLLEKLPENRFGEASGAFARYYGLGSLFGPLAIGWAVNRWEMSGMLLGLSATGVLGFGAIILARASRGVRR